MGRRGWALLFVAVLVLVAVSTVCSTAALATPRVVSFSRDDLLARRLVLRSSDFPPGFIATPLVKSAAELKAAPRGQRGPSLCDIVVPYKTVTGAYSVVLQQRGRASILSSSKLYRNDAGAAAASSAMAASFDCLSRQVGHSLKGSRNGQPETITYVGVVRIPTPGSTAAVAEAVDVTLRFVLGGRTIGPAHQLYLVLRYRRALLWELVNQLPAFTQSGVAALVEVLNRKAAAAL